MPAHLLPDEEVWYTTSNSSKLEVEGSKVGEITETVMICELHGNTCLQSQHLELIQENGEFKDSLSYGYTVKPGQGVKGWG